MRKIPILWLVVSAFLVAPALAADVPTYVLQKDKSSLKFYAIQNGAPVEGEFKDFSADIKFDPDQLDKSSITADVNVGSIKVANGDVESNLKLPEWLSINAFPHATFKSKTISRMPQSDNYFSDGELTLRGKAVPVTLNFQLKKLDDRRIAEGYISIRRSDFGIGQGEWSKTDVIKDEVRITLRIVADKK